MIFAQCASLKLAATEASDQLRSVLLHAAHVLGLQLGDRDDSNDSLTYILSTLFIQFSTTRGTLYFRCCSVRVFLVSSWSSKRRRGGTDWLLFEREEARLLGVG